MVTPAGVNAAGSPYPAVCNAPQSYTLECSVTMTSDVCRNVSDDFVDSAGGRHCFHLAVQRDSHGVDECSMDTPGVSVREGSQTCKLSWAGLMNSAKSDNRVVEICSSDGRFVGWQCPPDAVD